MIKHIVMWDVRGESATERERAALQVKRVFEGMRGRIPGLRHLEVGVDVSRVDYACDVVLYSEFESMDALKQYAHHPVHLQARAELEGVRIARHQVDYTPMWAFLIKLTYFPVRARRRKWLGRRSKEYLANGFRRRGI
jgi:heme-degrading monooxygenase HmoA